MTAYLSLNDPRFFKQYYFSTGKPFESEHLFLLYRYPEFTSHYFDILVGLCVTHNFVNFLELDEKANSDSLNPIVWEKIENFYRDIETSDLTKRSKYPFFSEEEIREIDQAVSEAGIARDQTVRQLFKDFDRESSLLALSNLQVLIFFYCARPAYQAQEPLIRHGLQLRDTQTSEKEQKKHESGLSALTDEQQESYQVLQAEQDAKLSESEKGFTTIANPLDIAPILPVVPVELLKMISFLAFVGWWATTDNATKNPFAKSARQPLTFNSVITDKSVSWDINEQLFVSQAKISDYASPRRSFVTAQNDGLAPSFFDVDFPDFEEKLIKNASPNLLNTYEGKLHKTGAEALEQTLRAKVKKIQDQFNYLRTFKCTDLEEKTNLDERLVNLENKQQLTSLDQNTLNNIYFSCLEQVLNSEELIYATLPEVIKLETLTPQAELDFSLNNNFLIKVGSTYYEVSPEIIRAVYGQFLQQYQEHLASCFNKSDLNPSIWSSSEDLYSVFAYRHADKATFGKTSRVEGRFKRKKCYKKHRFNIQTLYTLVSNLYTNTKYSAVLSIKDTTKEKAKNRRLAKTKLQQLSALLLSSQYQLIPDQLFNLTSDQDPMDLTVRNFYLDTDENDENLKPEVRYNPKTLRVELKRFRRLTKWKRNRVRVFKTLLKGTKDYKQQFSTYALDLGYKYDFDSKYFSWLKEKKKLNLNDPILMQKQLEKYQKRSSTRFQQIHGTKVFLSRTSWTPLRRLWLRSNKKASHFPIPISRLAEPFAASNLLSLSSKIPFGIIRETDLQKPFKKLSYRQEQKVAKQLKEFEAFMLLFESTLNNTLDFINERDKFNKLQAYEKAIRNTQPKYKKYKGLGKSPMIYTRKYHPNTFPSYLGYLRKDKGLYHNPHWYSRSCFQLIMDYLQYINDFSLGQNSNENLEELLLHSIFSTRVGLDSRTVWNLDSSYNFSSFDKGNNPSSYLAPNQNTYNLNLNPNELGSALNQLTKRFEKPRAQGVGWRSPEALNKIFNFQESQEGIIFDNLVDFYSSEFFNTTNSLFSSKLAQSKKTKLGTDRLFNHSTQPFSNKSYHLRRAHKKHARFVLDIDTWLTGSSFKFQPGRYRSLSVSSGFLAETKVFKTKVDSRLHKKLNSTRSAFLPETIWNWETRSRQPQKYIAVNGKVKKLTPEIQKESKIINGEYHVEPQLAFPFIDNYLNETNELLFDRDLAGALTAHDMYYRSYFTADTIKSEELTTPSSVADDPSIIEYAKVKPYVPFVPAYPTNDYYFYEKNVPVLKWATKIDDGYEPLKPTFRYIRHILSQLYKLPILSRFGDPSRFYSESAGIFEHPEIDDELHSYSFSEMLEGSYFLTESFERRGYTWYDEEVYEWEDDNEEEIFDTLSFFNALAHDVTLFDPLAKRVFEYGLRYDMDHSSFIREETQLPLISQTTRQRNKGIDPVSQSFPETAKELSKLGFESPELTPFSLTSSNRSNFYTRQRGRRTDDTRLSQSLLTYEWYRKDLPPPRPTNSVVSFIKGVCFEPLFINWQKGEVRTGRFGRDYWVDWPLIRSEELDDIVLEPAAWSDFRFFGCNSGVTALFRLLCNPIAVEAHLHPTLFVAWLSQLVSLGVLLGILILSIHYFLSPDITGNDEERGRLHQNHPYFGYDSKSFRNFIGAGELFEKNHPTNVGIQAIRAEDNDITFMDVADTVDIYGDVFIDIMSYFNDQLDFYDEDLHRDKSFFFIGRKGTGKKTAAQAIAKEINGPLFTVSAREFTRIPHISVIECIRYIFELADLQSPCVMYVTDFEYIGISRAYTLNKRIAKVINPPNGPELDGGVSRDELYQFERAEAKRAPTTIRSVSADVAQQEKVIMTLLIEYDLLYKYNYPFLMIASSTKPKNFDNALMRPGRLGRILSFGVLTPRGRARIISANCGGFTFDTNIDWYRVMAETTGHFGHEIVSMCQKSVNSVQSLNNIAHTEGTLEVAGLLKTIALYQEVGKKSEAEQVLDYELDTTPSQEEEDPNKIPDEFYYFLRNFENSTSRQKRNGVVEDTNKYALETMRNAYYQAARFFVFKWLDDPVDFRTMRFLDRQIEETMDYLRIKNTFMPWGETKLAIGLNYLLYLISGLAGEMLFMKGRFPIGFTRLDRETTYRKNDLKAFDSYIDEFYLNFDTFRENFKKDQSLYFLYADVPHHNSGSGFKKYQTEGFHEVSKSLKSSLTNHDPAIPRAKLPQKDDPSLRFNMRRNQLARRLKLWDNANPLPDANQYYEAFYRGPKSGKEVEMLAAWQFVFYRRADFWQNYTGLVQTAYPQGPKEITWRRDNRMQGLVVATSLLQMVRPLVDFVAYALAQEGEISHSFLRGIIEPEFVYEFNVKESRFETALTQQVTESVRIQRTPYAFSFVTVQKVAPLHRTYRIRKVQKIKPKI